MKLLERTLCLAGGVCWLLFAIGFGFFMLQFLARGMGWESSALEFIATPALTSVGLVTALAAVVGLLTAAGICLVVSLWLFARACRSTTLAGGVSNSR